MYLIVLYKCDVNSIQSFHSARGHGDSIRCDWRAPRLIIEAFRWSLALIAKILVRSISEGSTLAAGRTTVSDDVFLSCPLAEVMKAINTNHKVTLKKAGATWGHQFSA